MNNKILLPQLTSLLASTSRLPKKEAEAFIKALFGIISETVIKHENVKVKGFGVFKITKIEARKSINVSTGKELELPAHYKLVFAPAKEVAEKVNKDFSWLDIVEVSDNLSNEELSILDDATNKSETKVSSINSNTNQTGETEKETELKEIVEVVSSDEIPLISDNDEKTTPKEANLSKSNSNEILDTNTVTEIAADIFNSQSESENNSYSQINNNEKEDSQGKDSREEELGEKLEEELGLIQPIEPLGPIEPDSPLPDQPITENNAISHRMVEELIQKELVNKYATKDDLAAMRKSLRVIKRDLGETDEKSKNSVKKAILISFFIAILLIAGGMYATYYVLMNKIGEFHVQEENINNQTDDDELETDDAIISHLTMTENNSSATAEYNSNVEEQVAEIKEEPENSSEETANDNTDSSNSERKSSAIKGYDTVSQTRYLTTISKDYYGNYHFWPYIYLENENILGHPDRIKPGTRIKVPDLAKYGIDPNKPSDVAKAKKLSVEIYNKYK